MRRKQNQLYTAFGETKTIKQWSKDPRCQVKYISLRDRIFNKNMTPEEAIKTPQLNEKFLEIYGERKTIKEWSKDKRCKVSYKLFLKRVSCAKINPELALKEEKVILIEIYGEKKTVTEWSKDHRCKVKLGVFKDRIRNGIKPEIALTDSKNLMGHYLTAFNETKTIAQWSRDKRSKVSASTLQCRIKMGMDPETAITRLIGTCSKRQNIIYEILKKMFPENKILINYKHPKLRFSKSNRRMELDIFIPDKNLAVEYQGEYHFFPIRGEEILFRQKERDSEKKEKCFKNNILFVEIDYKWDGNEFFIKDKILKVLSGRD